jgi:hypothetical protein
VAILSRRDQQIEGNTLPRRRVWKRFALYQPTRRLGYAALQLMRCGRSPELHFGKTIELYRLTRDTIFGCMKKMML